MKRLRLFKERRGEKNDIDDIDLRGIDQYINENSSPSFELWVKGGNVDSICKKHSLNHSAHENHAVLTFEGPNSSYLDKAIILFVAMLDAAKDESLSFNLMKTTPLATMIAGKKHSEVHDFKITEGCQASMNQSVLHILEKAGFKHGLKHSVNLTHSDLLALRNKLSKTHPERRLINK